jgi:hypothetical protein
MRDYLILAFYCLLGVLVTGFLKFQGLSNTGNYFANLFQVLLWIGIVFGLVQAYRHRNSQ